MKINIKCLFSPSFLKYEQKCIFCKIVLKIVLKIFFCFALLYKYLTFIKGLETFLVIGWLIREEIVRENGIFQKETKTERHIEEMLFKCLFLFFYFFVFVDRLTRYFLGKPLKFLVFQFLTFPQEISDKTKLHP